MCVERERWGIVHSRKTDREEGKGKGKRERGRTAVNANA